LARVVRDPESRRAELAVRLENDMIERVQDLPHGVDGLRLTGTVTKDDYDDVVFPLLAAAEERRQPLRLLIDFPPEFDGYTVRGALSDMRTGFRSIDAIERVALVTDRRWVRTLTRAFRRLMPYAINVYAHDSYDDAVSWLRATTDADTLEHHIEHSDVLVVEPHEPLRIEDIDALAATTDDMRAGNGGIRGVVVHAETLPGWASLGSLWRHVRLARRQAHEVSRVAIAAGGQLAHVAPHLARMLVNDVEVIRFDYEQLDEAVAWASAGGNGDHAPAGTTAQM
jgi:hypothetical protein